MKHDRPTMITIIPRAGRWTLSMNLFDAVNTCFIETLYYDKKKRLCSGVIYVALVGV